MVDIKDLYAKNKPAGGNGLFLKINDGETVQLRILDLPTIFQSEYEGKVSTKYAWPVYNHNDQKVQILQGGSTIYNAVNDLIQDDDYGDPTEYDIKVSRTGTGMDTKYGVLPPRNSKDVPEELDVPDVTAVITASPFASGAHKLGESPVSKDVVLDDIDDEPIDLSEVPFN